MEEGRETERKRGREGGREGDREKEREGGREGGREQARRGEGKRRRRCVDTTIILSTCARIYYFHALALYSHTAHASASHLSLH